MVWIGAQACINVNLVWNKGKKWSLAGRSICRANNRWSVKHSRIAAKGKETQSKATQDMMER